MDHVRCHAIKHATHHDLRRGWLNIGMENLCIVRASKNRFYKRLADFAPININPKHKIYVAGQIGPD